MRVAIRLLIALLLVVILFTPMPSRAESLADRVSRGQYLVERVGMCIDCHSPRNEGGEFIKEQWLKGGALGFKPVQPMPWATRVPDIAGLAGWTEKDAVKFLETGLNRQGKPPLPPMPAYRMDREDAQAVVTYLKSLK